MPLPHFFVEKLEACAPQAEGGEKHHHADSLGRPRKFSSGAAGVYILQRDFAGWVPNHPHESQWLTSPPQATCAD
jgi:hypothetical protein